MEGRKILIYLSYIHNGDWKAIYQDIVDKNTSFTNEEIDLTLSKIKSEVITILDPEYPDYLKEIVRPPFVLYYYGDISLISDQRKNIAVIGSRKNSEYGATISYKLAYDLSKYFNIVSGLARGIDGIGHRAAIESGNKTIAVLGGGVDYCYPSDNLDLYNEIKKNHLLISEYPGKSMPKQDQFPERNRLISAFSGTIVVGEASVHSGTFITVANGLQQGRNICCVPYPAGTGSACNRLIKEGAALVESAQDVFDELNFDPNVESEKFPKNLKE